MKKIITVLFAVLVSTVSVAKEPVLEMVIPFAPGSTTDALARYNARALTDAGITSVVLNKPGASGVLGSRYVANTTNVNSTLLTVSSGGVIGALMSPDQVKLDFLSDFDQITLMTVDPMVIAAPLNSPYNNAKELFDAIKKNPGKVSFGAHTQTAAIIINSLMHKNKTEVLEVPYAGGAKVNLALLSGEVDFALLSYAEASELYEGGKLKYLGVATKQRLSFAPNVHTLVEQGISLSEDDNAVVFIGVFAPKDMDPALKTRVHKIITANLKADLATNNRFKSAKVVASTPLEFKVFIKRYVDASTEKAALYRTTHPMK